VPVLKIPNGSKSDKVIKNSDVWLSFLTRVRVYKAKLKETGSKID